VYAATYWQMAWLLTCGIDAIQDAERARSFAEKACDIEESEAGGSLARYLDTLALAHYLSNDVSAAVDTEKRAVDLQPESAKLAETLAKYEAALLNGDAKGDGGVR